MLASWLQSRFGISNSYCYFVHVPTSLEEGVLQDPTLNLLIYHFVKSCSYVLVQFLWSSQYLSPLIDSTFMTFWTQGVSMSSNCNWSLEPMNGSWETHSHRKLLLQELEDLQHLKAFTSSWFDPVLPCFFSQKVTDFYILQMDKFHFPGPRCGFYVEGWKAPLQFVAGFSLILFLTTNPRWWNFQMFFWMFTPNKLGEDDAANLTRAHMGRKKPTNQPNQLTTNLPVWSCRQVRVSDLLPPSITSQNPKKSRRNRPPKSRREEIGGEGHDILKLTKTHSKW